MTKKKILTKDFGKSLLKKLEKEKVKQVPKYIFIFKQFFVLFLLVSSIFIGSLSLSISYEYLANADWNLIHRLGIVKIAIIFMPFFWIGFLLFASYLAYFNFKRTETGYKYSLTKIFTINIFSSVILAVFLYLTGASQILEGCLENTMPKYRSSFVKDREHRMIKVWQNEDRGLIIGKIIELRVDDLDLNDYNNKKWRVIMTDNNTIKVKHMVKLRRGEKVKIIGEKIDHNLFQAHEIRPFIGKRHRK